MGCSRIRASVLAVAALTGFGLGSVHADTIYLKGKNPIDGADIQKETYKAVVYRKRPIPNDIEIPMAEVQRVEYSRTDKDYVAGRDARKAGAYQDAIKAFQDVSERSPYYQYALFQIAESYFAMGQFDKAISAYDDLLQKIKDTKFYPQALAGKARSYAASGKKADAKSAYQTLERETQSKGFDPSWEYDAKFQIAVLEGKGRNDFELMARDFERKAPTIAAKARLQVGYTYVDEKKYSEAIDYFDRILADEQATDSVRAGAWAGLSQCHIEKEGADEADFKEATLAALRTVLMYPDATDAMPRALFHAGRGFQLMRTPNTPWKRRANENYDKVIREYGSTEWADKAKRFRDR
ncbi:MAG: tetratricopeptide repeat protein [Planctomycetota bacterium]